MYRIAEHEIRSINIFVMQCSGTPYGSNNGNDTYHVLHTTYSVQSRNLMKYDWLVIFNLFEGIETESGSERMKPS